MFDWFWAYLTYRGGTRLITGSSAASRVDEPTNNALPIKAAA